MTSLISIEAMTEVARDTWMSLLADEHGLLPWIVNEARPHGGSPARVEALVATVDISGEWNGTACLSCSLPAGRRAASLMFGMDEEGLSDEEVADAVGELINVVGGNIKGLLPAPSTLSLPVVHSGPDFDLPSHLELALEVHFTWIDEPVMFTVWNAGS